MNATALAKALTEPLSTPAPARRRSPAAKPAVPAPFHPDELTGLHDDDLKLERAAEAMRGACRDGRLEHASQAAAAAMPTPATQPARSSVLRTLARAHAVPMAPPDENRLYLLRRLNGAPVCLLRMRDNGRVSTSGGSAVARWTLADGCLELQHGDGKPVSRLLLAGESQGMRLFLGESQLDGSLHLLTEVRCTYSRLRMLDAELAGPFGALYDSEAMVPVALPERPVVVLATSHSGAQPLLRALNGCPQVLIDGDVLQPHHISLAGGELRAEEAGALYAVRARDPVYFTRVLMARSHHLDGRNLDNNVPVRGFQLNPAHAGTVFDWVMDDPSICVVHVVRDNLLAEYTAILADGTDTPRRMRLHFEPERFERFVTMKQRYLAMVQQRLDRRRGAWAEIEATAMTRQNIADLLGFLAPQDDTPPATPVELPRQRSELLLDRFDNPDAVREALAALGRDDWANV